MLIYLSDHPYAVDWGTGSYDGAQHLVGRASGAFNTGLMFLPAPDTRHGFTRRPIRGVRRSLIINYVASEWRSRHELAYLTQPVVRVASAPSHPRRSRVTRRWSGRLPRTSATWQILLSVDVSPLVVMLRPIADPEGRTHGRTEAPAVRSPPARAHL